MAKQKIETVRELIYWSYSNLAMAHSAVDKGNTKYGMLNYMIRAKLFKGLKDGTMNIRTIFEDEKIKIFTGQICNYCGSSDKLSLDHIFPQKHGGQDFGENLILACKSCNSSKRDKDLIDWMMFKEKYLPLMVIRRYLKLVYNYCADYELLDKRIEEVIIMDIPFRVDLLPTSFPKPSELILNVEKI